LTPTSGLKTALLLINLIVQHNLIRITPLHLSFRLSVVCLSGNGLGPPQKRLVMASIPRHKLPRVAGTVSGRPFHAHLVRAAIRRIDVVVSIEQSTMLSCLPDQYGAISFLQPPWIEQERSQRPRTRQPPPGTHRHSQRHSVASLAADSDAASLLTQTVIGAEATPRAAAAIDPRGPPHPGDHFCGAARC
jgi:hypothetical protein